MTAITTANVFEAFDEAADRYDLMVALNPGLPPTTCGRPPSAGRAAAASRRAARRRGAAGRSRLRIRCLDPGAAGRRWTPPAYAPRSSASTRRPACWTRPGPSPGRPGSGSRSAWPRSWPSPGSPWGLGEPRAGGVRGVPVPQRHRAGQGARRGLRPAAPTTACWWSRSTRSPDRGCAAAIWSLVCWLGGHPAQLADLPADPALPLPVAQRAAASTRCRPSSIGCTARGSSTWRCGRCRAGSAASCTPSAPASRRASPHDHHDGRRAGVPGGIARAVRHPGRPGDRRAAAGRRGRCVVAGGGIAGHRRRVGPGRARRSGDPGRAAATSSAAGCGPGRSTTAATR